MRRFLSVACILATLIVGTSLIPAAPPQAPAVAVKPEPALLFARPPLGMTFPGKILSAHDADSVIVELRINVHLRLKDCWAPEINSDDPEQRAIAIEGRDFIRAIALQKECIVNVPFYDRGNAIHLADSLTMERWVARVWIKDEPNAPDLSTRLVQRKLAATEKKKPLGQ